MHLNLNRDVRISEKFLKDVMSGQQNKRKTYEKIEKQNPFTFYAR